MRTVTYLFVGVLLLACLSVTQAQAEVNVGATFDKDGLKAFHVAIGEHYQVPQEKITVAREEVSEEELPAAFIIAEAAHVDVPAVAHLRLGGMSWLEITLHYGLSPRIFYVRLEKDPGPPYGKAYGHFKNHEHNKSEKIHMSDAEIVDWANLRFLSEYYHCSPDEVIKSRQAGHNFVTISTDLKHRSDEAKGIAKADKEEKDKNKPEKKGKPKHK